MKKIFITLSIVAAFSLTACQDFLDKSPVMSQSDVLQLSTIDGIDQAIAGAYSPLASTTWYGADFILINEMRSANGKKYIGSTYDSGRLVTEYNITYTANSTSSLWGTAYYVISAANNCMDALTDDKGTEAVRNNLKAECLFLRALSHFDLVRMYAQPYTASTKDGLGVPVVLKTDAAGKPARNTISEVYAQVIADLKEAESLIDPAYVRSDGNDPKAWASLPAIQALLSRVYLYSQDYDNCIEYATKVIENTNYNLWSAEEYAAAFNADVTTKGEVIFEVYGAKTNSYDGYHDGLSPMTTSNGYGDGGACADLMNLYDENDVRGGLFSKADDADVWWTTKYAGKSGSSPDYNNTFVIRLSEVILNRAEAYAQKGETNKVLADLKLITDARGAEMAKATVDGVLDERWKELAWEGHLFFDLGRNQKAMTRTDYIGDESGKTIPWPSNKWALPIPLREINVNENLEQNAGY